MAVQVQLPDEPSIETREMSFPSRMVTPAKFTLCSFTSFASPASCCAVVSVYVFSFPVYQPVSANVSQLLRRVARMASITTGLPPVTVYVPSAFCSAPETEN